MPRLLDKVVFITGASGDIGSACAELCAKEGALLVLHSYRHPERVERFLETHPTVKAVHINCDGACERSIAVALRSALRRLKRDHIDVLVNNAGDLLERRAVQALDWEFVERTLAANVKPAFFFTKHSLPYLRGNSSLIFISSLTARWGKGDRRSAYGLAKGAVMGWAKSLANELGPKNIRVNVITPGFIQGNFHKKYTARTVAKAHRMKNPLRRLGLPIDVAGTVVFLASDEASYINGVTIDVCGGDYIN